MPGYGRRVALRTTSTRRYPWPRFWTTPGENIDAGFFPDLSSIFARAVDAPRLSELTDEQCLILLGEPGLGKSHAIADAVGELQRAGRAVHCVDLGAYDDGPSLIGAIVDAPVWREWRGGGDTLYLFLDALDEALLHVKAVHKRIVAELTGLGDDLVRLRLRISCRSAEWLADLESQLVDAFGSVDATRCLVLAPLRAVDAAAAARAEGLNPEAFVGEIVERDLGRLAAFPLTLRMMLDVAVAEEGALPTTQAELFDRAILRLAEEHDVGRRRELTGHSLHVGRRVAVAERVAAAMVLAGKAAIDSDLTVTSSGDLTVRELEGFTEEDSEAAGGASFRVGAEQVQEVLATALFVDLGAGRLSFAHRSLAEYLAARYLVRHDMDAEQIMSLLASVDASDGRLIPQLREVAAWTAALDEEILVEIMEREPELLLRADDLSFSDEARERMVGSLLTDETAGRVDRYDRRMRHAFAGLVHAGLADQVRAALRPGRSIPVRQMAFTLAQAAAMPELQPDLVTFAFDSSEPAFLRDDAVWALKDYADSDTRAVLVPLATEHIEDDADDEIKGQALAATFPSALGISEVLAVLTAARNEHLIGAYSMFVSRTFPQALGRADLPEALAWARTVPRQHGSTDLLSSLTDAILAEAWPHLDDERIRAGVIDVIKPRLIEHHELLGSLYDSNDGRIFREPHGRRLLVSDLADEVLAGELRARTLSWSDPPLVAAEDYPWVVERLRAAAGTPEEAVWAALAATLFTPEACDVEEMFELAELSQAFAENTACWRRAVELDSEMAEFWASRAGRRRKPEVPDDAPDMDEVITGHLQTTENGDSDAWWHLNLALIADEHGRVDGTREIEADITQLAGWKRADGDVRERIIAAGLCYLERGPPDPDGWFSEDTLNRPACAGYRALHLLAKLRPAQLDALDGGTWERWMAIIVSYPRSSGTDDERVDDLLVAVAADRASEALADWTSRMIDVQNARGEGHLFVMWRLHDVRDAPLVDVLGRKLAEPDLKAQARGDLAEWGMRADSAAFLPHVAEHLTEEAIARDRDAALAVAAAALGRAPGASWSMLEAVFGSDSDLGKAVFEKVAYGQRVDMAGELDDDALSRLLEWLYENFPPDEDPGLQAGAGWVTPRDQAGQTRDRLMASLAARGSDQAVTAVDALAARYPSYGMTRRKADAREARLARWTACEPRHVILLAQSNNARIVLSDAHLQQAVTSALRRIENRLQDSSPPAAAELWNTRGEPMPKHEEELSNWLKGRLDDDLRVGGRVIGRELQIRANATGRGRGESSDVSVFAPIGTDVEGAVTASVTIEVKACWHADLKTAMKTQLVERYLTGTGTTHGVYLVFWFAADNWDPKDSRRRRCTRDPQQLNDILAEQARTLTAETQAIVRSLVIDGSLPPTAGPARRIRRPLRRLVG